MSVNYEIKSQLAKLLATEDLVVEHKKVETAQFNVHTRVLTLPLWERASSVVYDMLVGHEVGHALYTPDRDWLKEVKIPPQFVNIVEDVRIEKLIKRRYMGLSKTFYKGYKELSDKDFFQIEDEDVDSMNLGDRANLYFKIGNFIDVSFTEKEQSIIDRIAKCETFDEVLVSAEELYKYCKEEFSNREEDQNQEEESSENGQGNSADSDFESESEDGQPSNQQSKSQIEDDSSDDSDDDSGDLKDDDIDVKTANSLEEAIKELASNSSSENVYLEIPELDIDKIIVTNQRVHNDAQTFWFNWLKDVQRTEQEIFGEVDKKFVEFKRSAQKEVNYLVKEFECRKAADSYARATTARTGVLDCTKLHTYKYNEDLFKKVTTLADGKNHGLVFVLDWSGSMCDVMMDTVKQLFNLVWFCKKVNIPFEVYAFTNEYPLFTHDEDGKAVMRELAYKKRDGVINVGEWFSLMNFFTSKVNNRTLEEQMKNIFRVAESFSRYSRNYYPCPPGMSLSGTPLNETMIALHQILPKFKNEHKLQKIQCVVLTDGEGYDLKRHVTVERRWEDEPYIGCVSIDKRCILRDRKTGNTYSLDCEWYQQTDILLRNLRDKFTDINFIGIRVVESRDAGSFIRRYCGYYGDSFDSAMKDWRKEKAFSIKNSGYNTYFGMSSNILSKNSEFEVKEDATKTQIKTAFVKSLKTKKMNKKILGEFIELIA
jgi:hypothetical protein